jgi:methylated-DNA-[protein]-cysteine S-methyltransferase
MNSFSAIVAFPVMNVGIRVEGEVLTAITYLPRSTPLRAPQDALSERAASQIERYRDDPDAPFDLPLALSGNSMQRAVWAQISSIPRGRTRTYGELAAAINAARSASLGASADSTPATASIARPVATAGANPRIVGQCCGDNPFPIVVPCHRVVAADGLGGFAHHATGFLIEAKTWLLRHECLPLAQEAGSLWHAAG